MTDALTLVQKTAKKVTSEAKDSPLSDPKGLAVAGIALAAVPVAIEGIAKLAGPKVGDKVSDLGEQAKQKAKQQVAEKTDELTPDMPKKLFGEGGVVGKLFGGGDAGNGEESGAEEASEGSAAPGHGSGRRMPIQQSVDVAVPVKAAYNHWTEFEKWPEFMHRIESAEQVDDCTVSFEAKIWGITKRFEAEIVEQRPDERIEWNVTDGYAHTGVVTFHPLSKNLTRIDLSLDIQPSNLIDKASRGMRFAKRAVRGDLHRFKAYAELAEDEPDGWRGTIEDGEVKRRSRNGSGARGRNGSDPKRSKSRSKG
jgi:uncharacterized membrane protein